MARLDELERKFEENPRRYFAPLANEYRKAGDARRAADLCRSQLPEIPGHISGHIVLGQSLYDSGDFTDSRAALETALALDPENIVALRYLGDIARDTGDVAEAERWYARTLEADPYNEAATLALQALQDSRPAAPAVDSAPDAEVDSADPTDVPLPFDSAHQAEVDIADSVDVPLPVDSSHHAEVDIADPVDVPPPEVDVGAQQERADESQNVTASVDTERENEQQAESGETSAIAAESYAAGFEPTSHAVAADEAQLEAPPAMESDASPTEAATADLPTEAVADEVAVVTDEDPRSPEFAGDLAISTGDSTTEATEPTASESSEPDPDGVHDESPPQATITDAVPVEPALAERSVESASIEEVATAPRDSIEEPIQAEERVMEAAAPFVTETMADLYMEQGYPHEALELLLQLAEQRPSDEPLRAKIDEIQAVIVARRDAAIFAARAERAERDEREADEAATAVAQEGEAITVATDESVEAPAVAPFDAAVAEVDSSAFVAGFQPDVDFAFQMHPPEPAAAASSVREMFARMDKARPRPASAVSARPLSRLRSDFAPMPQPEPSEVDSSADPFDFPDAPTQAEAKPAAVPRTSGPQAAFNPSTAPVEDFDAWLRGLRGP